MAVNHLKNKEAQNRKIVLAFGLQSVSGTLCYSKTEGSEVYAYNALGEGEWNACKGAFYVPGEEIPASDYHFHTGAKATGMTTGPQTVDSFFPNDVPHSRTAAIGYKVPSGFGNPDTANNPPNGFKGIFETKKCPNFNASGGQTDFSYSTNPARAIAEILMYYARIPNLPTAWANAAAYWLSRIDWGNWTEFRDFHNQTETVDYRTWTGFDGFGLRARYYSGTNFETFVTRFVHANFNINYGSQPPAANVAAGNFSGKFDGYIKFPTTETYTIYLTVDNGSRLWLDNVLKINAWLDNGQYQGSGSAPWVSSATYNATANAFVPIELHWNDGGVIGSFKVEWESASTPRQVVPSKYLYPVAEAAPLYETHLYFESPTSIGAAIREILFQSNSIMQDVNGKLRFFCLEQLTPSFTLNESNIDSFEFRRQDILRKNPITALEALFKDLDSQYLQEPPVPVSVKLDVFARQTFDNTKVINLFNTTRWRAKKILEMRKKLEITNDLLADAITKMAKTYPIVAGDVITATHRKIGETSKNYLVRQTIDSGVEEASDIQSTAVESRKLVLQEWN